jgi:hypothetical protein
MNQIAHSLVGYDRLSERVAEEFVVPDAVLPKAKELARVPADDPDAVMCYPLDVVGALGLADLIEARIDPERCDYFLEGFEDSGDCDRFVHDAELRGDEPAGPRRAGSRRDA